MNLIEPNSRSFLLNEFQLKRNKNSRYSLRMMAGQIGLQPGRLSEFFSGKRAIGFKMAEKIATKLAFDPEKKQSFLACLKREKNLSTEESFSDSVTNKQFQALSADHFHAIADWYHFAILSLMEVDGFQSNSVWIARRLGISSIQSQGAIERLTRVGLVEWAGKNLIRTKRNLTTTHDVESAALKHSHRQTLEQTVEALENLVVEDRDITSITMAIDKNKLPEAKKMIRSFRRRICSFLENGERNEVFNLNIQLYPISKTLKDSGDGI